MRPSDILRIQRRNLANINATDSFRHKRGFMNHLKSSKKYLVIYEIILKNHAAFTRFVRGV